MIYKGLIIDISDDYAIVLTDKVEYYKVVKKENLSLGENIIFLEDDIYIDKIKNIKKIVSYAAVLLLIIISSVFIPNANKKIEYINAPVAIISLDINPSVEYEIDKNNRLINYTEKNEDASLIVNKEMIGKEIKDILYETIENAKEFNYLKSNDDFVIIGVGLIDNSFDLSLEVFEKDLLEKLKGNEYYNDINLYVIEANKDDIEASRENKISIGKYKLCDNYIKKHQDADFNHIKNMNVKELIQDTINEGNQYRNRGNKDLVPQNNRINQKVNSEEETIQDNKQNGGSQKGHRKQHQKGKKK